MLQLPNKYSTEAADAADRLRLLVCDLRLVEADVQSVVRDEDEQQAILMHLRRMVGDVEKLSDDILTADRKGSAS